MAKRDQTEKVQVGARMREYLRRQLETAARLRDVSLNTEIVDRLERSFVDDEARRTELFHDFCGERNHALALVIARIAGWLEGPPSQLWSENENVYRELRKAIDMLLDALAPPPANEDTPNSAVSGEHVARAWISHFWAPHPPPQGPMKLTEDLKDRIIAFEAAQQLAPLLGRRRKEDSK